MKKATWLASILGLAVAAWATLAIEGASVENMGSYSSQNGDDESLVRRGRGSSGGSSGSYGSGGGRRSRGSSGSSGGRRG